MISKELLSKVLKIKCTKVQDVVNIYNGSFLEYFEARVQKSDGSNIDCMNIINIHELAHRCKEWADKHSYRLSSELTTCTILSYMGEEILTVDGHTEPEAIFSACDWVLGQLDA